MAVTFSAALVVVVLAALVAGPLIEPSRLARVTVARGPIVAQTDSQIVDINTTLEGGEGAAAGTGMVLTSSGVVLTNNHVIEQATSIQAVDLGNGRTYRARVLGYDERRDIAVLQLVGASALRTVKLGDSKNVLVGARVVTVGNAGGIGGEPAARSGTVLAIDRAIEVANDFDHSVEHLSQLIQFHGDLQPGDSGGPMVDAAGAVIGMDTAASTRFEFSGRTTGQGFAIEIDALTPIAHRILAGRGSRTIHIGPTAFIGVEVQPSARHPDGARVAGVISGTPAATAGLGADDVIVALAGRRITSNTSLTDALVPYRPGSRVSLRWREPGGREHTARITLGTGPAA